MPVQIGAPRDSGFDQPLRLLSDCHRRVEMFLGVLTGLADLSEPITPEQAASLQKALDYFRDAAPKHTADEEESLFPRLSGVLEAEAAVRSLEGDHISAAARHETVDRLGRAWLREGRLEPADAALFAREVSHLKAMYEKHIRLEDEVLFPLAERVLPPDQKRAIGREMAARRGHPATS